MEDNPTVYRTRVTISWCSNPGSLDADVLEYRDSEVWLSRDQFYKLIAQLGEYKAK